MKYAFMTFSTPTLTLDQNLELAERLGYDGIEPRLDSGHAHGIEVTATPETRRAIRERVGQGQVELACLATSLKFADPAANPDQITKALERIRLAGDLKVPCLRVFGGTIPKGIDREPAIDRVAEALRQLAEPAAEHGVTLCLETHDDWCDPAHIATVMSRVCHPAVGVNWDIMHPVRTAHSSMRAAFETLRPWIRHLHVHDGSTGDKTLRLLPIGTGDIDHAEAIRCLVEMEYDGFVSGEWINWESSDIHLPRELATLRKLEADARG